MHRLLVTAAAGLLTLGVLAGCSSDSKAGVGKVKVDKNGATSTVTGGQSAVGMGGNTLPPSFPRQAVPLHGTYLGSADAYVGMDVSISVVSAEAVAET